MALALLMAFAASLVAAACEKNQSPAAAPPPTRPTLRLFVVSTVAGALEPCGCQKDMLGGVDHAAALVDAQRGGAAGALVVGAGPMFFADPVKHAERGNQDLWKAEALALSYKDLGLSAWAPGFNDWAHGQGTLAKLREQSGAALLGANLTADAALGAAPGKLFEVAGLKLGVVGAALPRFQGQLPEGVRAADVQPALEQARDSLRSQGAGVVIGLVALDRGEALRLAEKLTGFQLLVVGKPFQVGEGNDPPTPPVLVGETLVVQAPNHLQAVSVVDLYVRDGDLSFSDASGISAAEERQSLKARVDELEKRIREWEEAGSNAKQSDIDARKQDLATLKGQLGKLEAPAPPADGSFFRYDLSEVREAAGSEAQVVARLRAFYKRVNEHNKQAFADKRPPEPEPGKPRYVGVEQCASCHEEELKFWQTTGHAHAYETLTREHKEFNLDCVGCHVTGYEKPGGSTVTHVQGLTSVQCETCHGAGSLHVAEPKQAGLITLTPERSSLCGPSCHHPPHVNPDWDVNQAWSKIIGPGHGM